MQHAASGRHLHSHASAYPERAKHNVVTCFGGESENDWWIVQPASSCSTSDPPRGPVPHGAAIRLQHYSSSRYLCSGQAASHVESGEWEVSAAAAEDAVGCEQWLAFFSHQHAFVRLQHDTLAAPLEAGRPALYSRAQQHYPAWGHQQQEVTVAAVAAMDAPAPASTLVRRDLAARMRTGERWHMALCAHSEHADRVEWLRRPRQRNPLVRRVHWH